MIFDAHMHVGDFPLFRVSLDGEGLRKLMRECSIERGVVFHPDNELVRKVVSEVPGAYALVWANPRIPGNIEQSIRWLDDPNFVGIKLHPLLDAYHPNDPSLYPLVEVAVQRKLPILIHCGHPIFSLPWSIEELAVTFPQARIILGHMGHGNIVYINASIDVATRHEHVYLETSGMPMHSKIAEAVERAGPDRVLYGSDAPFHHPDVEILKVRKSGLPPRLLERMLYANAQRLFLEEPLRPSGL